jgi:hypothetical protein
MTVRKSTDSRSSGGTAQGMTWDHPKKGRLLRTILMAVVLAVMSAAPVAADEEAPASDLQVDRDVFSMVEFGKSWS